MKADTLDISLDHDFLDRLKRLFLRMRHKRRLHKRGPQASLQAGTTREFKDHRAYSPGDDFRNVDWRLYARLERLYIRIYEEVQELHLHVLLDTSRSMLEPCPQKGRAMFELGVALCWLGLEGRHRVSLYSIDSEVRRLLPPLKGIAHIKEVLNRLKEVSFRPAGGVMPALKGLRLQGGAKALGFLISDLYGENLNDGRACLRQMNTWPGETHLVHLVDPLEMNPDDHRVGWEGDLELEDVDLGQSRRFWARPSDLARYREIYQTWLADLRLDAARRNIDYQLWTTDLSFEDQLIELLSRGSRLAPQ